MSTTPSPTNLLKTLLPSAPHLLKTAVWHSLGLSHESSKWDIKITMLVSTIRALLSKSTSSVSRQQRISLHDPGVKGPVWIAPVTLPAGLDDEQDDLRQLLFRAIDEMKETPDEHYTKCDLLPVEAEWTGYRANVGPDEPPPTDATPEQLYKSLCAEAASFKVILYFHGGAHYMMDPCSHRGTVSMLCKHAGGARALNVRYRLAPGNPFPAAILDSLVAYLSLLYPAPGAFHAPVDPKNIIFAGDSAGGNICFSLLALLLHLQRQASESDAPRSLYFVGHTVNLPIPLPGGVATSSPWVDFTRSCPSLTTNAHYDYLPVPSVSMSSNTPAASAPISSVPITNADAKTTTTTNTTPPPSEQQQSHKFTTTPLSTRAHRPGETLNPFPCPLWPSLAPRADLYTHGSTLTHPLVSPLILPGSAWANAPPLYFLLGEEMLSDEANCIARRCVQAGVSVRWVGYEAMPHCFGHLFMGTGIAAAVWEGAMKGWGEWCGGGVGGRPSCTGDTQDDFSSDQETKVKQEGGTWVAAKTLAESDVDVSSLAGHLSDEECWARMREEKRRRCEAYERLVEREGMKQKQKQEGGENAAAKL